MGCEQLIPIMIVPQLEGFAIVQNTTSCNDSCINE